MPPALFEELVAGVIEDMGYQIQFTPQPLLNANVSGPATMWVLN